jgi:hypothetical protein
LTAAIWSHDDICGFCGVGLRTAIIARAERREQHARRPPEPHPADAAGRPVAAMTPRWAVRDRRAAQTAACRASCNDQP